VHAMGSGPDWHDTDSLCGSEVKQAGSASEPIIKLRHTQRGDGLERTILKTKSVAKALPAHSNPLIFIGNDTPYKSWKLCCRTQEHVALLLRHHRLHFSSQIPSPYAQPLRRLQSSFAAPCRSSTFSTSAPSSTSLVHSLFLLPRGQAGVSQYLAFKPLACAPLI